MIRFKEFCIKEAVRVADDRYMRSHGKKAPKSGYASWAFTNKRMGDVDYKNDKEFLSFSGQYKDAIAQAKAWAKKYGYSEIYMMEDVQVENIDMNVLKHRPRKQKPLKTAKLSKKEKKQKEGGHGVKEETLDEAPRKGTPAKSLKFVTGNGKKSKITSKNIRDIALGDINKAERYLKDKGLEWDKKEGSVSGTMTIFKDKNDKAVAMYSRSDKLLTIYPDNIQKK